MLQEYCILKSAGCSGSSGLKAGSIKSRNISEEARSQFCQYVGEGNKVLGAARPSVEAN